MFYRSAFTNKSSGSLLLVVNDIKGSMTFDLIKTPQVCLKPTNPKFLAPVEFKCNIGIRKKINKVKA